MSYPLMLCMIVSIPFMGAGLILLTGKYPNLRDSISFVVATILCASVYQLIDPVRHGSQLAVTLLEFST